MRTGTGKYGLRYALKASYGKVAHCSLSVDGGTRAELDLPEGTAHFVEHSIFRGTQHKSASRINSYLDRLGGELNAYTTKEEIVLHATVLKEDLRKAASLLLELACDATFPENEIETERGVVLDEIISYKDSPSDDIYDNFEHRFFEGSSLDRFILGTSESVRSISREDMERFYRRCFQPGRMALSIVAPMSEEKMEELVLKLEECYFSHYKATDESSSVTDERPVPHAFDLREDKDLHESNVVIGAPAVSIYETEERLRTVLLANILGGPASDSLLGRYIRERRGWVYGIECSYNQYRDCGLVSISLGCDRENLERCLKAVQRITGRVCENAMSERSLNACKKQLFGQLAISSDSGEAQCLSMGKSLLSFGKIWSDSLTREMIEAITPEQLRACAESIFRSERLARLIYI